MPTDTQLQAAGLRDLEEWKQSAWRFSFEGLGCPEGKHGHRMMSRMGRDDTFEEHLHLKDQETKGPPGPMH